MRPRKWALPAALLGQLCVSGVVLVFSSIACGPPPAPTGNFPPVDRDGGTQWEGGADAPMGDVTPDGTWVSWTETGSCVSAAGLYVEVMIEALALITLTSPAPGQLQFEIHDCMSAQSPVVGVQTTIPDTVLETVPVQKEIMTISGLSPGASFQTSENTELWGYTDPNPLSDSMPTLASDPRVYDQDMDGNPGVSLYLGNRDCYMFIVQLGTTQFSGSIVSEVQINASGLSTSAQNELGNTGGFCATQYQTWFPANNGKFTLLRADGKHGAPNFDSNGDGQVSCDEVREQGLTPFPVRQPNNDNCAAGPP